jgi:hypothetical protein
MSVMQLIEAGSLDSSLLALLWAMLSRRASLLVAAEPPMAGKTTTLTALLDLTPPQTKRVYLRGHYETFDFVDSQDADPRNTYVLANEMSDHLVVYLWGSRIYKTFELVEKGYAIGSTMHAETVDDVIAILDSHPLNVPAEWIARLTLVINLYVSSTYGSAVRRFNTVHMLEWCGEELRPGERAPAAGSAHAPDSIVRGVRPLVLSSWDRRSDSFDHRFMRPEVAARLASWAGCTLAEWEADIARRKAHLDKLQDERVRGISATREGLRKLSAP